MTKALLRKKYFQIRKNIDNKREKSLKITEAFLKTDIYKNAKTIMLYFPMENEVNTLFLAETAIKDGKKLYFPKTDKKNNVIIPMEYNNGGFIKGAYGIYEPFLEKEAKEMPDVVIVPALCVDSDNYRLGYGGGYYDRFLKNYKGIKVTLIFSALYEEKLPTDEFDIKTDIVITER